MLKKTKVFLLSFLVVFLFSISLFSMVSAQDLEIDYPDVGGQTPTTVQDGLPVYAQYIFKFALAISGFIILFALISGGLSYILSAGNPSKLKEARARMTSAFLGAIILFSSYIILVTINPSLVILDFGPLTPADAGKYREYVSPYENGSTLIVAESPLKASLREGSVWEDKRTKELETLITDFDTFLNSEIKMDDSNLENDTFTKISDLNKYLKTVSDECRCENTNALCSKPQSGSMPIGCSGDPCNNKDGGPSARERINNVLAIDKEKMKILNDFREKIINHEKLLRAELGDFQRIEGEINSCRTQNNEFLTLNDLLLIKQQYEESGDKVLEISGYKEGDDALTFYCPVGGTVYDAPYLPQKLEEESRNLDTLNISSPYEKQLISCHTKVPTGKTIDQLRESAVTMTFKLDRLSILTEQMTEQVQEMTELISQCNRTYCKASCSCIPNPCYGKCVWFCAPFCKSRCLQAVGGCNGDACPVIKITDKSEEIKETEKKIFETIKEIQEIFPNIPYNFDDPKNPINLENLDTAVRLCFDPSPSDPQKILLNCEDAKGNYGPNGTILNRCNPRDLYCCSPSNTPPLVLSSDSDPIYIVPLREHNILPNINGCPQGYNCTNSVKNYNQYDDASEPLKQLLACVRQGLDVYQESEKSEEIIGLISSISDEKLYTGTCHWDVAPENSKGCSHTYEIERTKRKVSAHYGGTYCRFEEKSYAVDFDMSSDLQKKYVDEIIKVAKQCAPEAYVLDEVTNLHIDIGELYACETSDF